MKLFEFEAKSIIQKYGIAVPQGKIARTPDEAVEITREIGKSVFLKSQVTISGRGKAGGIVAANSPNEVSNTARRLLGSFIKGIQVSVLLVEEKLDINEQFYASIVIDRQAKCFVILISWEGGVDIEEIAQKSPRKIMRLPIDPLTGLASHDVEQALSDFRFAKEDSVASLTSVLITLYRIARENDAELLELNPLVKTNTGDLVAADARIILDDNAIFRHPEFIERYLNREEDTPLEAEARKQKLAYVDLDGDIGIIGNGAGLVMATLDMVHLFGGKPANFLDIGGGAQVETIKNALLLVMSKPEIKAVLINILGGITRCDLVATGVVEGLKTSPVKKPIAVRMMGTNEKEGQDILRQNGIGYYPDMEKAAEAIIRL
jgi:succinyl-CoA synthetase beta subunit